MPVRDPLTEMLPWSLRQWLPPLPMYGPPLPLRLAVWWPWVKPSGGTAAQQLLSGINASSPTKANLDAFRAAADKLASEGKITGAEYQQILNRIAARRTASLGYGAAGGGGYRPS